jgi:hypothetical protein
VNSKDRDEAVKWMRLGYETHGLEGLSAVADAMGIRLRPPSGRPVSGTANATNNAHEPLAATQGSASLAADEQLGSPDYRFRYGPVPQPKRPPLACPPTPPRNNPNWRPYVGNPKAFHCGFDGFLENREPSPHWPIGECFYDEGGQLVDDAHPYAGCKGTPDQYEAEDGIRHFFLDDGGPVWSGGPALWESLWYSPDDRLRWEGRFKQHRRPR